MVRVVAVLALVLGLAAGGGVVYLWQAQQQQVDPAAVRAIVAEVMAERDAAEKPLIVSEPAIDEATLAPMIEDYLMGNPRILQQMSEKLETEVRTAEAAAQKQAIAQYREAIFNEPGQIVVGNPNGDVTLVEMFDYNCSYCRGALPDLATLIAEDPNLKVVLKEFPILSQGSVEAAKVGILVGQQDTVDYWDFHQALFQSRGQVGLDTALDAAEKLGLSRASLQLDVESAHVDATIQKSYDIAKALNISGTPTYIIGDELIPGAIGIEELRTRIANMRACGATACPPAG